MEAQGQVKYSSKISVQSRRSQISSCRSLERPSWSDDHSLNKNRSLIEVMSLQGSKKSDLYEKILAEDLQLASPNRKSNPIKVDNNPFHANAVFNPYKTCFKPDPQEPKRFSYEKDKEINHICLCYLKCKGEGCPCYDNLDQQCVNELCCKECIELKQTRKAKPGQTMEKDERVFCTCKKTKCNKKYCSCFAMGIKCGIDCSCEDCLNCDKMERMEVKVVCIVDQEIKRMEMPESMDFQPFAFRYSYQG